MTNIVLFFHFSSKKQHYSLAQQAKRLFFYNFDLMPNEKRNTKPENIAFQKKKSNDIHVLPGLRKCV